MGLLPTLLAAFCTCILAARLDNDAANYQIRVIDDLYSPFSTFLRDAWAISAGGDYKYVFSLRLEAAETELLNPEVLQWNPSKRFVVTPVYLIFVPPFNAALLAADPTILLLEGDALAVAVDNYQGFMVQCKLSYIASTLNKHLLKMCSGSEGLQVPNDYFDSIFDYRLVIRTKTVSHVNISANIILVDQLIHLMPDDHTPNEVPVSPPPAKYSQWLVKLGIEMVNSSV